MKKQKLLLRLLPVVSVLFLSLAFAPQHFRALALAADKVEEELPMPPPATEDAVPNANAAAGKETVVNPAATSVDANDMRAELPEPPGALGDHDNTYLPAEKEKMADDPKNQASSEPEEAPFLPAPKVESEAMSQDDLNTFAARISSDGQQADYSQASLDSANSAKIGGELDRPPFSLMLGYGSRSYGNTLVPQRINNVDFGVNIRLLRAGSMFSLNGNASFAWGAIGNVGAALQVSDFTTRFGLFAEMDFTRRFSLLGGLFRRTNVIKTLVAPDSSHANDLTGLILHNPAYSIGAGAQYEIYVIPHGSLGVRAYMERDYYTVSLVVSMEPRPRSRNSINYGFDE